MNKLQSITTKEELAKALGFTNVHYINYLLYKVGTDNLYYSFSIPKKNGGLRCIHAPKPELKFLQRKLYEFLQDCHQEVQSSKSGKYIKIKNISHGFERDKSIITNAENHRNKKYVINIDLENFFDSFNFGRVRGFFIKDKEFKTSPEVATVIAQIACYKGKLPQGAPSSPIITNLITRILDFRIVRIAKKYRFTYTRYADDLTFSTNRQLLSNKLLTHNELENFVSDVKNTVISSGFEVNEKKTRLSNSQQRQEVTGLVVNKKVNVKKEYIKNTRAMAFNLYKDGKFEIDGELGNLEQLTGRFAYIFQISQYNNYLYYKKSLLNNNLDAQKYLLGRNFYKKSESRYYWKYIFYNKDLKRELYYNQQHKTYNLPKEFYQIDESEKEIYMTLFDTKEKEYKKFLFYKYFFGNIRPMIITEGKTDPRYIKAALKNLYNVYPTLISKNDNKYNFHIDFMKHSNTIEYLFNVPEGGGGFNYWYNYFSEKQPSNFFKKSSPLNKVNKNIYNELYPNYIKYFGRLTNRLPKNPTIFLFDNEPSSSPLYNFANYASELEIPSNTLENVRRNNFNRVSKMNSLYVMATPVFESRESSDIEDLLLLSDNNREIVKDFLDQISEVDNNLYSVKKHKELFSKYVLKNYSHFDFKNFIPLLDGIVSNIEDYRKIVDRE